MFRRKEEENATSETETAVAAPAAPVATPAASAPASAAPAPVTPVAAAPIPQPVEVRHAPVAAAPAAPAYRPAAPAPVRPAGYGAPAAAPAPAAQDEKGKRRILTVGNDILLKGEIATCDRLVIEGAVDATLKEVHTVEIAQNGSFKGSAEIEDAEISGVFEGDLIVRNRLIIYSTGKVRGKITYGEIEIERGGELTGEIKTVASAGSAKESKTKAA